MEWYDAVLAILRDDPVLAELLPGGIHDRPLDPDDEVTGRVWQPHPVTGVERLVPCAVLLPPQEVDHPRGLNPDRRLDVDCWPELVFYAERRDMAATFDAADLRAMELLHGRHIGLADITATGYRAALLDADELPGDVWTTFRRYRAELSRHIAEAVTVPPMEDES